MKLKWNKLSEMKKRREFLEKSKSKNLERIFFEFREVPTRQNWYVFILQQQFNDSNIKELYEKP